MSKPTAYILAGGKSSRFNYQNKALLQIDGKACIEYLIDALIPISNEVVIVADQKDYESFQLRQISDIYQEKGPISAIYSALEDSKTEWNIICPCDLPFMTTELFLYIEKQLNGADICYANHKGRAHFLTAFIRKSTRDFFREQIRKNSLKVSDSFDLLNAKAIEIYKNLDCYSETLFFNMNREADYKKVKILQKAKKCKIKLKFFGQLAEEAGCDEEEIVNCFDLKQLKEDVRKRIPNLDEFSYAIALNQDLVKEENRGLNDGDEVAFLPPFAGG